MRSICRGTLMMRGHSAPEIGRALAHIAGERRLPYRPKDGDDDPEVTRLLEVLDGLGFTIQIVPKEAFNC
jgi:hypothetical protein